MTTTPAPTGKGSVRARETNVAQLTLAVAAAAAIAAAPPE
jgi:hypothetical protein